MAKFVSVKVGTPKPVRLSYVTLTTPKKFADGATAKYSAVLLIPKSDTETVKAIKKAAKECFDSNPSVFKDYDFASKFDKIYDGDGRAPKGKKYGDEYAGFWVLNASNSRKPALRDKNGNEILDESEIYSGCWAKVGLTIYAYNNSDCGLGVSLDLVKKVRDDEHFAGGGEAKEEDYFSDDDDDI